MKKLSYLLAASALLAACAGGNKGYTVTGTVEGAADGDTVYLATYVARQFVKLDSAVITNGTFTFKGVQDTTAYRYLTYSAEGKKALRTDFFLENGNIKNSVNYPNCDMGPCTKAGRIAVCHKNVKNMITQFSGVISAADINIAEMTNKSRGDYAYSLFDLEAPATDEVVAKLEAIDGVFKVRVVK